jgi:hypothetical protein
MTFARLLHDFQWMGYQSRTVSPGWPGLPSTPETVPFFTSPSKGDKDDVPLDENWDSYLRQINGERGYKFIISPPAGWFNRNHLADSLGFGGNVVEVEDIVNDHIRLKSFHFKNSPPPVDNWHFQSHPELIHKFTAITQTGQVINPATDIDAYVLVIGRGPLYVPLTRAELFPELPMQVTVHLSKSFGLQIFNAPNGSLVGKYPAKQRVTLLEYLPKGTDVWARTDQGWVKLYSYTRTTDLIYHTTWSMKTLPAVPAVS